MTDPKPTETEPQTFEDRREASALDLQEKIDVLSRRHGTIGTRGQKLADDFVALTTLMGELRQSADAEVLAEKLSALEIKLQALRDKIAGLEAQAREEAVAEGEAEPETEPADDMLTRQELEQLANSITAKSTSSNDAPLIVEGADSTSAAETPESPFETRTFNDQTCVITVEGVDINCAISGKMPKIDKNPPNCNLPAIDLIYENTNPSLKLRIIAKQDGTYSLFPESNLERGVNRISLDPVYNINKSNIVEGVKKALAEMRKICVPRIPSHPSTTPNATTEAQGDISPPSPSHSTNKIVSLEDLAQPRKILSSPQTHARRRLIQNEVLNTHNPRPKHHHEIHAYSPNCWNLDEDPASTAG